MLVHRMPSDVGCRCAGSSGTGCFCVAGPVLVGQNLYMWLGHLHSKFKLPYKNKDNNICSTLYIVKALFDLSMWDIS